MSKLSAFNGNQEFFFTLESKEPERIEITMYSTNYVFVKQGDQWVNGAKNVNDMSPGLIAGVLKALENK